MASVLTCENCKKSYPIGDYWAKKGRRFCGNACRGESLTRQFASGDRKPLRQTRFAQIVDAQCKLCSKSFSYKKRPSHHFSIFCSNECRIEDVKKNGRPEQRKPELDRACARCSGIFRAKKIGSKQRFCSNACRGAWQTDLPYREWRGKLSLNRGNRPRGAKNPQWGRAAHHGKSFRYQRRDGTILRLRSSWELAVATYLDKRDIQFEYEPKRFNLKDRTYLPDFFLTEQKVFWEVKGWLHARHAETIRQFREMQSETPLVVIGLGSIRGMAAAAGINITRHGKTIACSISA